MVTGYHDYGSQKIINLNSLVAMDTGYHCYDFQGNHKLIRNFFAFWLSWLPVLVTKTPKHYSKI